jgi:small subunit ribosomal protein S20
MASTKPKKKNPRLASGRKRARQDVKLNAANTSLRSKYRTAVKNVEKAVWPATRPRPPRLFAKMQSVVDTVADKGIFHKNKAARDKSRLSAKVKALALSTPCGWTGSTAWHHCTANVCSTWAAAAASCPTRWPAEVRRCWA